MRVQAAIEGRLGPFMEAEIDGAATAVTRARNKVDLGMRNEVRRGIQSALGPKMAKSWKSNRYPRTGRSTRAAVFQYDASNGDWIIRSVTESGPITAKNGRWLALPTEEALSVLSRRFHHARSARGRSGSIGTAIEKIEQRFGRLQFVYRRGQRRAYLIAEVRATSRRLKSGETRRGFSKSSRSKKTGRVRANTQSVVMFILVLRVRRAGTTVNLARIAERYAAEFAQLIVDQWPEPLR